MSYLRWIMYRCQFHGVHLKKSYLFVIDNCMYNFLCLIQDYESFMCKFYMRILTKLFKYNSITKYNIINPYSQTR